MFSREANCWKGNSSQNFTVYSAKMNFEGIKVLIRSGMPRRFKWKQPHKQAKCQMNYSLSLQAGFDFHQHKQYLWFSELSCTKSFPRLQHFCYSKDTGKEQKLAGGNLKEKELRSPKYQTDLSNNHKCFSPGLRFILMPMGDDPTIFFWLLVRTDFRQMNSGNRKCPLVTPNHWWRSLVGCSPWGR